MENLTELMTIDGANETSRVFKGTEIENCDEKLQQVFWIVNGILAVIILTGNVFTCVIFLSAKKLRQQHMNIFLVSLAVSDILMAVMVVPGYTAVCAGCKYLSSDTCWILAQTKDIVFSSTFFSLLAITYDRYLAVLCPLQYSAKMNSCKVTCIIVMVWVSPALVATARNIWWLTQSDEKAKQINKVYNAILVFALVVIPALIMALVNALIVRAIRSQRRRIIPTLEQSSNMSQGNFENNKSQMSNVEKRTENSRKRKGTIACVAVVLVFVLSWIPRSIYNFAFVFGRDDLVTPLLVKLSMFFLLLQSCSNPIIYSFYRADFRQAAKRILKCA